MDAGLFAQYVMNGLMLGMMYALVAVSIYDVFGVGLLINVDEGGGLAGGPVTRHAHDWRIESDCA